MEKDFLDLCFERQNAIVTRRVAGEVILVPIDRRIPGEPSLYTLDPVAAFLWESLDGRETGRGIAGRLQEIYEVDSNQAEADVRLFLEQLLSIQAIRSVPA